MSQKKAESGRKKTPKKKRRSFTDEQKKRTVRYIEEQRAKANRSMRSLAEELGIADGVLRTWCRKFSIHEFRPVEIVHPENFQAVLVTPQGIRVEGLDVESLIRILRAVS